jgi:hypothetical protein
MDSDEAITQLMANARWLNPFGFYFWGQDRLGAWPYLTEWVLHRLTGLGWSWRGLYAVLAICVLSAVWPLCRIAGRWGWCAAIGVLGFLVVDESSRRWFLSIGQPYAWQLSSFFWAWWFLHRQATEDLCEVLRLRDLSARRWWRFVAPTIFTSLLSIWSSPLSAPFLWIVAITETWRVPAPDRRRGLVARLCGSVLCAVLVEQLIRITQQKYSSWHHWRIFFTEVRFDRGHIIENLMAYSRQLLTGPDVPITTIAVVVLGAGIAILFPRTESPAQVRNDIRLAVACFLMGLLNVITLVFMSWGRVNDYSGRYLIPTRILWLIADVAWVAAAIEMLPAAWRSRVRATFAWAGVVILLICAFLMPRGEHSAQAEARARVARELPEKMPDGILFGCYWGTYSLIDGGAPHALTPVVHHAATHRTPWTPPQMKGVAEVAVSHELCPPVGPPENPTPYVHDRGVLLHLKTSDWFRDGPFGFSLYENRSAWLLQGKVSRGGQPVRLDADAPLPLDRPVPQGQEAFTVSIDRPGSQLIAFFNIRGSLMTRTPALGAEAVLPDGRLVPLLATSGERLLSVPLQGVPRGASVRFTELGAVESLMQLEAVAIVPDTGNG